MKIVLVSHFLNEHLSSLCKAFLQISDSFYFVATSKKIDSGYQHENDDNYVIHYYLSEERDDAISKIIEADAVIFGGCPNELIAERMKLNKLSFIYSERYFKRGTWRRFVKRVRDNITDRIIQYKDKELYILAASSYLPSDLGLLGFPREKCFKWGYFPERIEYNDIDYIIDNKEKDSILWVARMIGLKHPETGVFMALLLKLKGYNFKLDFVGDGYLKKYIGWLIAILGLNDYITLCGYLPAEQVRTKMESSRVLVFTSNKMEGWGAVVNEAMNSGCVVVSSSAAGSSNYLIENGKNGYIYRYNRILQLFRRMAFILDNPDDSREKAREAYKTIINEWNPEIAAERFVKLATDIIENRKTDAFTSGPCSSL